MNSQEIRDIVRKCSELGKNGLIFNIFENLQKHFRCLPEDALRIVAEELSVPLSQLYSVATFYNLFSLEPRGEHTVSVCRGTVCHVKGVDKVSDSLQKELGIKEGETTPDGLFTLNAVRCLGCCSLAPVISINGVTHAGSNKNEIINILDGLAKGD